MGKAAQVRRSSRAAPAPARRAPACRSQGCTHPPGPLPAQGGVDLGRISSLEKDHKPVDVARKGDAVAMKIEVRPFYFGLDCSFWANWDSPLNLFECFESGSRFRPACRPGVGWPRLLVCASLEHKLRPRLARPRTAAAGSAPGAAPTRPPSHRTSPAALSSSHLAPCACRPCRPRRRPPSRRRPPARTSATLTTATNWCRASRE